MKLVSDSVRNGRPLPAEYAFGMLDQGGKVVLSGNRNPHLAWSDVPAGTESLVLLCIDGDAPVDAKHANRVDVSLSALEPRGDFFHWSLVDLPPSRRELPAGALANGVTPHGKPGPEVMLDDLALRQGLNDYTGRRSRGSRQPWRRRARTSRCNR